MGEYKKGGFNEQLLGYNDGNEGEDYSKILYRIQRVLKQFGV